MKVWDLHCDTLYQLRKAEKAGTPYSFEKNGRHISLEALKKGEYLLQSFACFVDLKEDGENPLKACMEEADIFYQLLEAHPEELMQIRTPEDIRALEKDGRIGAMLTMEEGASCLDDIRILRDLYRLGVRMMTFTWNYENGLAWPNHVPEKDEDPCSPVTDKGMKEKGLEFLAEMERLHMIADVSHLGDSGIMDMLRYAKRPFAASHSNARALCGHVRNLTDEMIRGMGEKGCIAGLNYCPMFVDPSYGSRDYRELKSTVQGLAWHARHMMNMGGEDLVALGSDFDGIDGDLEIPGAKEMPRMAEGFLKEGFTPREIEKIFYRNAMRFFEENL